MTRRSGLHDRPFIARRPLSSLADDPRLAFRHAEGAHEIAALAETEDYGSFGETDLGQVTGWWSKNRRGNLLAVYDDRVVGGIDIWPITPQAYDAFKRGEMSEKTLDAESIESHAATERHHWYVGSISLDADVQPRRVRAEILLRLVLAAITECMRATPAFPAKVLAEAWTNDGRRMLVRFVGFRPALRSHDATDHARLYELEFESAAAVWALVEKLSSLLATQNGTEGAASARVE